MTGESSDRGPTADPTSTQAFQSPSTPPERIGNYRILQKIGEGGMGEVYLAEQDDPRRQVAVKIIKWGMDTRQVIARFEAERQALALMDHPNIAKVFDAGATEQGRPYFVMEYVKGVPITEHADRHKLTTRERLDLFIPVCEGVQHAHQKAVIHRDIKPSNVLVTLQDGKAVPKIIDFGVAKATAQRLTEKTMFTAMGVMIGTPEYMSPEQAEITAQDVDTRTDVYSLGVLLYELLVGALPFDPKELRRAGFDEIRKRIREDEPNKPSTRLSSLGDASTEAATRRRTDPSGLRKQLRGDLDWITMKAMDKQRSRRYGSPNELALDIRHHLAHEPVAAGPPGAAYRVGKFVRRHKVGVGFVASLSMLILALAITMTIQARRIARERDRANQEAATAEQVSEFLVDLFEVSDPGQARGNSITAREILDKGASAVTDELGDQPRVQARLMNTMGRVYNNLGLYNEAAGLFELAAETWRAAQGPSDPQTLKAMNNLAIVLRRQGKADEAERLYRTVWEGQRDTLGEEHEDTLNTMNNLALVLHDQRRLDEAEDLLRTTLEIQQRVLGPEHLKTALSMKNLAFVLEASDEPAEAERLLSQALDIFIRREGTDSPEVLSAKNNYAALLVRRNKLTEAEIIRRELVEQQIRILGERHPQTLTSLNNLAFLLKRQERFEEAELLYRKVIPLQIEVRGEAHRHTLMSMTTLGSVLYEQGKLAEAAQTFSRTLEVCRENRVRDDLLLGVLERQYGRALTEQGRYEEAETNLLESLDRLTGALGATHKRTQITIHALVELYDAWGRPAQAERFRAQLPPS